MTSVLNRYWLNYLAGRKYRSFVHTAAILTETLTLRILLSNQASAKTPPTGYFTPPTVRLTRPFIAAFSNLDYAGLVWSPTCFWDIFFAFVLISLSRGRPDALNDVTHNAPQLLSGHYSQYFFRALDESNLQSPASRMSRRPDLQLYTLKQTGSDLKND